MKKVLVINSRFDCPFQPHYGECRLGEYFGIHFECNTHEPYGMEDFPKRVIFDDPNMCPHHGGGMCRKTNPGRFSCYNEFPDECRLENYEMMTVKVLHTPVKRPLEGYE